MIREHFSVRLADRFPDETREAHRRLFEHLRLSAPELPENLNEMMPLYHAVAHGCKAQQFDTAWRDVYWRRIMRGRTFFSTDTLGAFRLDISAIGFFFHTKWDSPVSELSREVVPWLFNEAGFILKSLGRLEEARAALRAALANWTAAQNWYEAARTAINLTVLYRMLGLLPNALNCAEQFVALADKSADSILQIGARASLANIFHVAGKHTESFALLKNATKIEITGSPQMPSFFFVRGHAPCQALLDECQRQLHTGAPADANAGQNIANLPELVEDTYEFWQQLVCASPSSLTEALKQLVIARAELIRSVALPEFPLVHIRRRFDEAISGIRGAGQQDDVACGLLNRAAFWRIMTELNRHESGQKEGPEMKNCLSLAERDLSEAESISERCSMLIWQIEAALERTRLFLMLHHVGWQDKTPGELEHGDKTGDSAGASPSRWFELARHKLEKTQLLVKQTEKPYEPHVPDWDDWQPPEYVNVFKQGETAGYHCRNAEIERLQHELDSLSIESEGNPY